MSFNNDHQFFHEAQGCVRAAYAHGVLKVRPFGRIPYLFGRLGEPGVKRQVMEQFLEAPEYAHDDLTLAILSPTGRLRRDYDAMSGDGTGMSIALSRQVLGDN